MVKWLIIFVKVNCLALNFQGLEKEHFQSQGILFNYIASSSSTSFSLMFTIISRRNISEIRGNHLQIKYPRSMGRWPKEPATSFTHWRGLGNTPSSHPFPRCYYSPNIHTHSLFISPSLLLRLDSVPLMTSSHHLYLHFISWNWPFFLGRNTVPPTSTPYLLQSWRIFWTKYLNIKEELLSHVKLLSLFPNWQQIQNEH